MEALYEGASISARKFFHRGERQIYILNLVRSALSSGYDHIKKLIVEHSSMI